MPTPYMMIGAFVVFVIYTAVIGALLGVITDRTSC